MAADPANYSSDVDISAVPQTPDDDFDDLFLNDRNDDDHTVGQADDLHPPEVVAGSESDTDCEGFSDIDAGPDPFSRLTRQEEDSIRSNVPLASSLPDGDANNGDPIVNDNGTQLAYTVHTEKFTAGRAGAPINKRDIPTNQRYQHTFSDVDNIYAPFTSQLDWEVARWGKIRGSSSSAFNELLSIDGVSSL
jgi:hypothetical protein